MATSSIWTQDSNGWTLTQSNTFQDEATLQNLIEQHPEMLPLSGKPALIILGREVPLGSGYADLIGLEATGQVVIIEIKLAKNPDARRAVVAQILAYAACLHGTTREQFENLVSENLRNRDHESLIDAVRSLQEETSEAKEFLEALDSHLQQGRFRLVFVLDDVPTELSRLVAYLEHVTDKLVIDLVAINSFNIHNTPLLVPQRVTPERHEVAIKNSRNQKSGTNYPGSAKFAAAINQAPQEHQQLLQQLLQWAKDLEARGAIRLTTYEGIDKKRYTLLPRLKTGNAGLVTIWLDYNGACISFWRSVFEKRAPDYIEQVEKLAGIRIGQGNTTQNIGKELLETLTQAYDTAAK